MNYSNLLCAVSAILVGIAAINWGLYAYNPNYNLVEKIFDKNSNMSKIIYALITIAGIIVICCQIKWIRKKSFTEKINN